MHLGTEKKKNLKGLLRDKGSGVTPLEELLAGPTS